MDASKLGFQSRVTFYSDICWAGPAACAQEEDNAIVPESGLVLKWSLSLQKIDMLLHQIRSCRTTLLKQYRDRSFSPCLITGRRQMHRMPYTVHSAVYKVFYALHTNLPVSARISYRTFILHMGRISHTTRILTFIHICIVI